MILPNLIFDVLLFGLMAAAVAVDALQPVTHGAATLIVFGFIVFLASEDAAHHARRIGWGQESFASGIAVSLFGFVYFWWRNDSDTAATALHICLMLSALMVLIGLVSAFGAAFKESKVAPLAGLVVTTVAALVLGGAGGLALLFWTSAASLPLKLVIVALAFAAWRLMVQRKTAEAAPPVSTSEAVVENGSAPRVLRPLAGTALDRALPLIVLGALAALIAR